VDDFGRPDNDNYEAERKALQERFPEGHYWRGIDIGNGWMPLVIELDRKLLELVPDYKLLQVKEKFGGLRYYVEGVPFDSEAYRLIEEAESKSYQTCEECGEPGYETTSGGYWIKTLCQDHDQERIAKRIQREYG
jgi:hypothetical protein